MPGSLTFTTPIQGAPMTAARIKRSGEANLADRTMVLVVELYGEPGIPEVPSVPAIPAIPATPATETDPEIPAVPGVPGVPGIPGIPDVVHPTSFALTITDTISDALRASARAVDGIERYRKESPMACSALWQALAAGMPTEENPTPQSEKRMLEVLDYFGLLPPGVAATE